MWLEGRNLRQMLSDKVVFIAETKPTPATILFCIFRVSFALLPCVIISIFAIQVYAMSTGGDGGLHGTQMLGLNQERTGKKRQRSAKWSEAETIRLLECLRVRVQKSEIGEKCAKGSAKWEEIAQELQDSNFEFRSGKHVAEKWDTLRRVYLCVEEHLRDDGGFARALRQSREAFKLVPAEYTQRWHDLAAACNPMQKEIPRKPTKNKKHKKSGAQPTLKNVAVHQDPVDLDPALVVQLSGVALACHKLIRSLDFELSPAARSSPYDKREEPDNAVTALHSLVTAVKSQAKFVSSDSYLLEIRKRDWKLVEDLASSLLEKHHCSPLPIPRIIGHVHEEPVWGNPPDLANAVEGSSSRHQVHHSGEQEPVHLNKEHVQLVPIATKRPISPLRNHRYTDHVHEESVGGNLLDRPNIVEANLVSGEQEALHVSDEHMQVLPTPSEYCGEATFQVAEFKSWSLSTLQSFQSIPLPSFSELVSSSSHGRTAPEKLDKATSMNKSRFSLSNLIALKKLDFSSLKHLPEGFGILTSLKTLFIWNCKTLEEVPYGLSNFVALEKLNFSKCLSLKHVPEGFGNLTCLKKLDMWECEGLQEFPYGFRNLIALEELSFHTCRSLKHLPEGFGDLTCLKKLDMWECEALEDFPYGLSNLKSLEELSFYKCRSLKHVPEGFGNLTCLKKLDMSECEALEEFPYGLSNLIALEELSFHKCRSLKHVREGFGNLTSLKKLNMWECEALEDFPYGLSNLIALEELSFHKCGLLKHVHEGFGNLTCLKKLDMWECEDLEEFPFGLSNLIALEELSFHKCRSLKHVLEGFGNLTCLKKLDMWECEDLEEFPYGLSNLKSLEELSFHKCCSLKHVPKGYGNLTCLKKLDMWECETLEEFTPD